MKCMRLISIGEVGTRTRNATGTREREGGGLKAGRYERPRATWEAVKGPHCLGAKMEAAARWEGSWLGFNPRF